MLNQRQIMKPPTLGTILPTRKSEADGDRFFAACQARQARTAQSLSHLIARHEQGETRYYESPTKFAIVNHYGDRILWFEHRPDGIYAVK